MTRLEYADDDGDKIVATTEGGAGDLLITIVGETSVVSMPLDGVDEYCAKLAQLAADARQRAARQSYGPTGQLPIPGVPEGPHSPS